jgi:hypothetical protein
VARLGRGRPIGAVFLPARGIVDVTLTSDVTEGTRSGSPVDTLKIGVILTTDVHAGTRTGSPVDAIGNTVTSDVHAGTRRVARWTGWSSRSS